jgi:hypothetical protein
MMHTVIYTHIPPLYNFYKLIFHPLLTALLVYVNLKLKDKGVWLLLSKLKTLSSVQYPVTPNKHKTSIPINGMVIPTI